MKDHDEPTPPAPDPDQERTEEALVRSMLRRARVPRTHDVDLLPGVQARIRQRSRGRFYGDGWSRSRAATSTYVVTAVLMLSILLLVYFIMLPGVRLR